MFLGFWQLGATLSPCIQLSTTGNVPSTADSAPTFRIYSANSDTPISTGTASGEIDSQTGWHRISQALTIGNGYAIGVYTVRVRYVVSSIEYVQFYSFQVV
jgi:hypothetical protein